MAKNNNAREDMSNYASRHPRRMWGSAFLAGTALGASMMATKKNRDKNALQKFMDQIGR